MKINLSFIFLAVNLIICASACASKTPSTFESGIFERNVSQVTINSKHIEKNTKQIENNLNEVKEVQTRLKTEVE